MRPARGSAVDSMQTVTHTLRAVWSNRAVSVLAALLISGAALAAYGWAWPEAPVLDGDSAQYMEVAADLRDGRLDRLHFRTPGYPLLLVATAATEHPTRALFFVSLFFHLAAVWLLAAVFRAAGASWAWILLLVVLLLLPPYVEPAAYVMTENLAQLLLVAGFAALVFGHRDTRLLWWALAGIAFSSSALVRPVYQFLPLGIAGFLLVRGSLGEGRAAERRRSVIASLIIVVIWAGVSGAYAAHNRWRFGWFGIAPSTGLHLTTRTVSLLDRVPDEYAVVREILIRARDEELIRRGGTHTGSQAIWAAREQLEAVTGLAMPELSAMLVRMNVAVIRRAPLEYAKEVARSLPVYWFPAHGRLSDRSPLRWCWVVVHGVLVATYGLLLAMLVAMAALRATRLLPGLLSASVRNSLRAAAFPFTVAVAIVLYTMVLTCLIDIGEPRQRRSTDALFVFATVLGTWAWGTASRAARQADATAPH